MLMSCYYDIFGRGKSSPLATLIRLRIVVIAFAVIIPIRIAGDLERRFLDARIFHRSAKTIGLIVDRATVAPARMTPSRSRLKCACFSNGCQS